MTKKGTSIRLATVFLVLALSVTTAWLLSQETAEGIYEAALLKKEASGDLQGAIQLFQKILKQFPEKRDVAAKAQFQIGACYEKLGTAEAVKAYELVLKNYADQPELVAAARERLAALRQGTSTEVSATTLQMNELNLEAYDVSRDGTKLVGLVYEGPSDVVVYDLDTKHRQLVTHFGAGRDSYSANSPIWSFDEREIAFMQTSNDPEKRGSELRAVSPGGKSRLLWRTDDGEVKPCDWLKDGQVAVLWHHGDKSYTLGLVPAGGGSLRNLCAIESTLSPDASASPDGKYIGFTEGARDSQNIRVIRSDGTWSQTIADHPADDMNPIWSPDGNHLAFLSTRHGGQALWAIAMNDGRPVGQPFLVYDGLPRGGLRGWTSRGIFYDGYIDLNDIFLQSADPKSLEWVGRHQLLSYQPSGDNASLRWSPDGRSMAFAVSTKGYPARVSIAVMPAAGGTPRMYPTPLVRWGPTWASITWRPDGRSLASMAAAEHTEKGIALLFQFDLVTGEQKIWPLTISSDDWASEIAWSRDGQSIFYVNGESPGSAIVEKDLMTGREVSIYRLEKGQGYLLPRLLLTPDYRKLLFMTSDGTEAVGDDRGSSVRALDLETRNVKDLYSSSELLWSLAWSPDGQTILAVCNTYGPGGGPEVRFIPSQGGASKKLKIDLDWPKESGLNYYLLSADWSPDGKQIGFHVFAYRNDLIMIRNVTSASPKK